MPASANAPGRQVDLLVRPRDGLGLAGQPGYHRIRIEVVGVDHGRLLGHLRRLDEILHQAEIALPDVLRGVRLEVEDVLVAALVNLQGDARRDRVDHPVLLGDRGRRKGQPAGECAEQHVDVILVDQPLELRLRGLVRRLVVADDDLDRLAEQAARLVDQVDAELVAGLVLLAVDGQAAGHRQGGADPDRFGEHRRREERAAREPEQQMLTCGHHRLPFAKPCPIAGGSVKAGGLIWRTLVEKPSDPSAAPHGPGAAAAVVRRPATWRSCLIDRA